MKKIALIFVFQIVAFSLYAQQYSIKGTVTKPNGDPIYTANVYLEGTTRGTVSNHEGKFEINSIQPGEYVLVVSRMGYGRKKEQLDITTDIENLNFELSEKAQDLGQVTVTGTGTPYHIKNNPVQTELVSEKNIEEISARNFESMMTSISPSFDFSPNYMGSSMKLNGLGSDYILMLVNGKRLHGGLGGHIDMNRINPENIERVEIVKGASSALYGSDAMGGVVNVITKQPENKVSVSNNTVLTKHSTWQQNNNIDLNFGKFSSHTSFTRKQTDGWQLSPYEYDSRADTTFRTDAKAQYAYLNNTINQRFEYSVTENLEIYASGKFYKNDRKRPQTVRSYNLYFEDQSYSGGAKYIINSNSKVTFDYHSDLFKYFYNYNQDDGHYSKGDKSLNKEQKRNDYELKWVHRFSESHRVSLGSKYSNEELFSEGRVVNDQANANTIAVFAQDEIQLFDNFMAVLGARFSSHKEFGNAFTPKATLMYGWNDFKFRANYARGFKAPTLKELYYRYERRGRLYLGNTNLEPQKSDYYATSVEYNSDQTSFSITGYHNEVFNMIDYKKVETLPDDEVEGITTTKKHFNIEEAYTQGVDFLFNVNLPYGFSVGGGYSFIEAKNRTSDIRLEGVAQNYANVRVNYSADFNQYNLNVSLIGRMQDEKFYTDYNADAYNIWKLTTIHSLDLGLPVDTEFTLGIDNLFDYRDNTPYGYHYGTLNPGRRLIAGLRINFTK